MVVAWLVALAAGAEPVAAQGADRSGSAMAASAGDPLPTDPLSGDSLLPAGATEGFRWLGHRSRRNRLIGGMWTLHPYALSFPRIEKTYAFGLQWRGFFGSTFINSHQQRTYALGIERDWFRWSGEDLGAGFGYRAGLLRGYDERLMDIADDIPAVPFVGLLAWARMGPYRFDSFYVYKVVTLELSLELW